ncbi:MAG: hypothetical protein WA987_00970 [Cellvibrio sp.]|jgi:hypothetical protein
MKKLIKLDPGSKRYAEVDPVKLERVTEQLLDYIYQEIPPNEDPFGVWTWVVPLCKGVLQSTVVLPLPYDELPLKYPMREGLLSDEFEKIYAPFANTITGTPITQTDKVEIDGILYAYVDFEEPLKQ